MRHIAWQLEDHADRLIFLSNHYDFGWYNRPVIAQPPTTQKNRRIDELDLLRGFFILVIIIDHFQRWPSLFTYVTGEGRLWVSAAEGFFIISGLLIGYLRGYRQREQSLRLLTKPLFKRAAILYVSAVIISFLVVAGLIFFAPNDPLVPIGPNVDQTAHIGAYVSAVLLQTYSNDWIFFLRLYAIMLVITPLFIYLLRRRLYWVIAAAMTGAYASSFFFDTPEAALQWQVLFFGAALIGYKLESIRSWMLSHEVARRIMAGSLITITIATMVTSYFWTFGVSNAASYGLSTTDYYAIRDTFLDQMFSNNPMMPARLVLSFVWVGGLFAMFHYARPWLIRFGGWLLVLFGTRSLSAYCLQALFFIPVQFFVPRSDSLLFNTVVTIGVIVLFWALLRTPLVQRLLPK